jgi:putative transposase
VKILKAFRFRVYPTPAQAARLDAWEGALRFLWNLALEQRKLGLARPRVERRYPSAFDQINELTELRAALPWLADVPRNVCSQLLVELDRAWQRCFAKLARAKLARAPRWKRRGRDSLGFCEPHPKVWRVDGTNVRFPKLGTLHTVMHRPLDGKPKTCSLKRDGDQWFVSIICELDLAEPAPRESPIVAIDRGITNFGATSGGDMIANPRNLEASLKRLAHAQRTVSRRKKGSKNREKAKARVSRIHRKVRRQRDHFLHVQSARLAKSHGVVVLERLNVAGMIRGRCARSIADAGWSRFANMLRYKLAWSGGSLVEVPAAYSSQTCSTCGTIDAESRRSQAVFCCTSCGYHDHADLNAAKILLARANRSGLPAEGSPKLGTLRNRKRIGSRVPPKAPPLGRRLITEGKRT